MGFWDNFACVKSCVVCRYLSSDIGTHIGSAVLKCQSGRGLVNVYASGYSYCKGVAIPTEFTVTMIPMLDSVRLQNKHGEETHPPYNFWI